MSTGKKTKTCLYLYYKVESFERWAPELRKCLHQTGLQASLQDIFLVINVGGFDPLQVEPPCRLIVLASKKESRVTQGWGQASKQQFYMIPVSTAATRVLYCFDFLSWLPLMTNNDTEGQPNKPFTPQLAFGDVASLLRQTPKTCLLETTL